MPRTLKSDVYREFTELQSPELDPESDAAAEATSTAEPGGAAPTALPPPVAVSAHPVFTATERTIESTSVVEARDPATPPPIDRAAITAPAAFEVAPLAATERRWPRIIATGVALVVFASVAVWGWNQHSSAAAWKTSAVGLETELATTQNELNRTLASLADTQNELSSTEALLAETQEQLAAVEEQLSDAEAQVEALDEQVATLANTKAQVEDERAQLSAILATAPAVTTSLRACAASNLDVSAELLEVIKAYPYRSLSTVNALLDDTLEVCEDAFGKANNFEATLGALGL